MPRVSCIWKKPLATRPAHFVKIGKTEIYWQKNCFGCPSSKMWNHFCVFCTFQCIPNVFFFAYFCKIGFFRHFQFFLKTRFGCRSSKNTRNFCQKKGPIFWCFLGSKKNWKKRPCMAGVFFWKNHCLSHFFFHFLEHWFDEGEPKLYNENFLRSEKFKNAGWGRLRNSVF